MPDDPLYLWAKKAKQDDPDPRAFHPLICHLLDVGAVAERLYANCLPASARTWFARQLGLEEASAGTWAIFLAAIHDWGKGSPAFQHRERFPHPIRHGTISTVLLADYLQSHHAVESDVADRLAIVIGGHHGVFPSAHDIGLALEDTRQTGRGNWKQHQTWLVEETTRLLGITGTPPPTQLTNAGAVWLAGFVSVADWIGSNSEFFPYAARSGQIQADFSIDSYAAGRHDRAGRAITALGWSAWPEENDPRSFADLFPFAPNDLQAKAITLTQSLHGPSLVIIEAPMGIGKTEAALYLADHGNVSLGMRGHYLALPTQATSNQMFTRDVDFLQHRYPGVLVNTQLLHGHAALSTDFQDLKAGEGTFLSQLDIPVDQNRGDDGALPGVVAAEWFTARKRGLLAPFGVGTIDQALLAVLQTRHFFVRMLGLAGKTIIFDEVHAYDTYMSVLLERLLGWLATLGCSVVLLSATLPGARRERLLRAYSGAATGEAPGPVLQPTVYPSIRWRSGQGSGTIPLAVETRCVHLRWNPTDSDGRYPDLGPELASALRHGGCAAVICNTVAGAQDAYTMLRDWFPPEELSLFHARFLYESRMERERQTLRQFGKPSKDTKRPRRAVIVATQVIEQSLDLDFDLMVSELAPVDLILQRSGRLHRHQRDRPPGVTEPELWLLAPPERDGLPAFPRATTFVYDEHVLLRSWLALRGRREIEIPDDITPLIEAVYDDDASYPPGGPAGLPEHWANTRAELEKSRRDHEAKARAVMVQPPDARASGFLEQRNQVLEEDNPAIHETLQALTRLGEQSITAICLTPEERERLRPEATDAWARAADLLRRSVNLTHRGIVRSLANEPSPPSWKSTALLRYCRMIVLDERGEAVIGEYRLRVDASLGIIVERDGKE